MTAVRLFTLAALLSILACSSGPKTEPGPPPVDPELLQLAAELGSGGASCPAGFDHKGAAAPRGDGEWCEQLADGRITILRTNGTRWAVIEGMGEWGPSESGTSTLYTEDGKTIARVIEKRDYETVSSQEHVPNVQAPPGFPAP